MSKELIPNSNLKIDIEICKGKIGFDIQANANYGLKRVQ